MSTPKIEVVLVKLYRKSIIFHAGPHYIIFQPRWDPHNQWLVTEFRLTEDEIENIVQEWTEEWREPVEDDQLSAYIDPRREGPLGT